MKHQYTDTQFQRPQGGVDAEPGFSSKQYSMDAAHLTLDNFQLWTVHALKVYLSSRKKSTNGNFNELAAR